MQEPSPDLVQRLRNSQQDHLLAGWESLSPPERARLVRDLHVVDFEELRKLYERRDQKDAIPPAESITPLPWPDNDPALNEAYRQRAEQALKAGEVAFLIVAGGQGTRLGFDQPKGMFPLGPVTKKTLFQIHVEKVLALERRYQRPFLLLVMTSPITDEPTRQFFAENRNFGLQGVEFFCQGTMPALDLATGKLLLDQPGCLCLSPDGHGGTLTGLSNSGLLERLAQRGIRTISYFQVDNPFVQIHDAHFLGRHLLENAEVSTKVVAKEFPTEKLGNLALVDGRCAMIEYSDLPLELAEARDEQGRLRLWAGNTAIHLFDVAFLKRVVGAHMPWHVARKKVPHWAGQPVQPETENALKFERFIFDVLPQAERWTVSVTSRETEFEPLKNATGRESPESVRQAMLNQFGSWLEGAGVKIPRDGTGNVTIPLEISPLWALDAEDVKRRVRESGLYLTDSFSARTGTRER